MARDPRDKARLHAAITQLAERDPLINVRQDAIRQEIYVSLYGEVQKQVVEATLATEYGPATGWQPAEQRIEHTESRCRNRGKFCP